MKEFFTSMLPTQLERAVLAIGAFVGWLWGMCFGACGLEAGWLCVLLFADYLTGLYGAFYFGEFRSDVGCRGIIKKFLILWVCALAKGLSVIIGLESIQMIFIGAFALNEMLSILENLGRVHRGFVPEQLQHFLEQLKQRGTK